MHSDYRPDIDGLRAIAVLSVILFHYGANWLPGGFAGVDVFFVISGYLITKHLSEDIQKHGFAIGPLLGRFYNKRIRRIVPALLVLLAATLAAGWFLLMPGDYASTGASASYSAFGLGNLYFYWNTGYFDREAELQSLLHLWSLGVEEQFYFVWPVLLALIMWASRVNTRLVAITIAVLVAAGLAYSVKILSINPKAAFFLPLPRAWELGIGALLAFLPSIRAQWASELAGVVGLALIGWPLFALQGSETSLGLAMLPAVIGAALLIWPRRESVISRLLAIRPMRFVGLISYSLYLWHWPLIVLFRHYNNEEIPSPVEASLLVGTAIVISYVSWRFIERPARAVRWGPHISVVAGLSTTAAVAAISATIVQSTGFPSRIPEEAKKLSGLDVMWQWTCPQQMEIPGLAGSFCVFGAPWGTAKSRGILWGDSHAGHFAPIVQAAIGNQSISVLLYTDCPAALGGAVRRVHPQQPNYVEHCASQREKALRWLESNDIQLVLLASSWAPLSTVVSQDGSLPKNLAGGDLVKEGLQDLINRSSAPDRRIVVLGQVPSLPSGGAACGFNEATGLLRRNGICKHLEEASFTYNINNTSPVDRKLASIPNITFVSPTDILCHDGKCSTRLDGEFLSRDGNHLRRNLSDKTKRDYAKMIGLTDVLNGSGAPVAGLN